MPQHTVPRRSSWLLNTLYLWRALSWSPEHPLQFKAAVERFVRRLRSEPSGGDEEGESYSMCLFQCPGIHRPCQCQGNRAMERCIIQESGRDNLRWKGYCESQAKCECA